MAPEVIKGCYNEKCDIWSIGILMYVLLVGVMPFKAKNEQELLLKVSSFENINLDVPALARRSIGAIDFLRKLLHVEPRQRPSAAELCEHEWLRALGRFTVDQKGIKRSLACLRKFRQVGPLQRKVVEYIVSEIFTDREADKYMKIFYTINTTSDGMCSKDQFIRAFWSRGFTEMSA